MLTHPDIKGSGIPVLFYANKMDIKGALTPHDCMALLGIAAITEHPWHVQYVEPLLYPMLVAVHQPQSFSFSACVLYLRASNALTGGGVGAGINWLSEAVAKSGGRKK